MPDIPRVGRSAKMMYLAATPLLLIGSAITAYHFDVALSINRAEHVTDGGARYIPNHEIRTGPQLVMVYVGSSTCPWSNHPELPAAVERIKYQLWRYAESRELSFKAIGLTVDWSPRHGIDHLDRFGLFDEVASGYGWGGNMQLRYLWSEGGAIPSTPQVIVYARRFTAPVGSGDSLTYGEKDRRTVAGRRGWQDIISWADSGARLTPIEISMIETSTGENDN
jgi:hypothetical protein